MKPPSPFRHAWLGILAGISPALSPPALGHRARAAETAELRVAANTIRPGTIATSAAGFSLKAKLNGKAWSAASMMRPEAAGRIIGYKGEDYLGLPFHRSHLVVGKVIKFGDDQAVDLAVGDDDLFWAGRTGEMKYTKIDATSAEGTFFFTATARGTSKRIEVTEGTFRILLGQT
ncbi:MAG: hypothetical protein JNL39_02160 [Opitutaceae bacterium]|nr:hypothetical protein [Opitutaceae bacterium]